MATLTVAAVRQRVAAALEALSGWDQSTVAYDAFPADTDIDQHKSFAVGVPRTEVTAVNEGHGRKRASEGGLVRTSVRVRWAHRVRVDGAISDTDDALAAEAAAIVAVLGISEADLHITLESTDRQVRATWLIGEIAFRADHRIALV